jgi:hypothetical protein
MWYLSVATLILFSGCLIAYIALLLYRRSHEAEHKESTLYEIRKDSNYDGWVSIYEEIPPMYNNLGEQAIYQVKYLDGQYGVVVIKNKDKYIDYLKRVGVTHWHR